MTDVSIRIHFRGSDGNVTDGQEDYGLEDFGGVMPAAGDLMLAPGAPVGCDRSEPENRRMWSVLHRVFNPCDNGGKYIALVVEEREIGENERSLLP